MEWAKKGWERRSYLFSQASKTKAKHGLCNLEVKIKYSVQYPSRQSFALLSEKSREYFQILKAQPAKEPKLGKDIRLNFLYAS